MSKMLGALEKKDAWNSTFLEDLLLSKIQYLKGQMQSFESKFTLPSSPAENGLESPDSNDNLEITTIEVSSEDKPSAFPDKVRDSNLVSDDYKIALITEWKRMLEER